MIKYKDIHGTGSILQFDDVTNEIAVLKSQNDRISWVCVFKEDGEFEGTPVKKGDVLLKMYGIEDCRNYEYVIVSDSKLLDYYERHDKYQEERRKEPCEELSFEKAA